jgi:hypothetical protein
MPVWSRVSWIVFLESGACLQVPTDSHSPLSIHLCYKQNLPERLEPRIVELYTGVRFVGRSCSRRSTLRRRELCNALNTPARAIREQSRPTSEHISEPLYFLCFAKNNSTDRAGSDTGYSLATSLTSVSSLRLNTLLARDAQADVNRARVALRASRRRAVM